MHAHLDMPHAAHLCCCHTVDLACMQVLKPAIPSMNGPERFYVLEEGMHHSSVDGGLQRQSQVCILALGKGATIHMQPRSNGQTETRRICCISRDTMLENCHIRGASMTVAHEQHLLAEGCSFDLDDASASADTASRDFALVAVRTSVVELNHCSVVGASHRGVMSSGQLTARHCLFSGSYTTGIAIMEGGQLLAEACHVRGNQSHGVDFIGADCPSVMISCTISSNGFHGITSSESTAPEDHGVVHVIRDCAIHHNGWCGCDTTEDPGTGLQLTDCRIFENGSWGVIEYPFAPLNALSITDCLVLGTEVGWPGIVCV